MADHAAHAAHAAHATYAERGVTIDALVGRDAESVLDDVARLRIAVFREFPYLYDGTLAYEARYLRDYLSPTSVVVVARRAREVVGVSTAMPLVSHGDDVVPPFRDAGFDPARIYYFGESVLRADHRGLGIGHAFFDAREAAARRLGGFTHTAFCAVVRPDDHTSRPAGYVGHDAFWGRRGYVKRPDMRATFAWKDLGEVYETPKSMVFYLRPLEAPATRTSSRT